MIYSIFVDPNINKRIPAQVLKKINIKFNRNLLSKFFNKIIYINNQINQRRIILGLHKRIIKIVQIKKNGKYPQNRRLLEMGGGDGDMSQNLARLQELNIPFMNFNRGENIPPRSESFWDMLKINLCPSLKLFSFTVFIICFNIIIFIVTSCQTNGIMTYADATFLQQNPDVLIRFGANYPPKIKFHGQVWRLISAAFLHGSFFHILLNTISSFIFLSQIERTYGAFMTFIMWIICAIGGNIFSADFGSDYSFSVGASTSLMGMLGLYLAFLILNWKALEFLEQFRCMLVCMAVMIVLMVFLMSTSGIGYDKGTNYSDKIDNYGHLGGFITGVFAGVVIPKPIQSGKYERQAKILFGFLLLLFFVLSFTLFFTATPDINDV